MTARDFIDHTRSAGSTPQARPCRLGSQFRHRWNWLCGGYTRIGIAFGIARNGCWVMAEVFADGEPSPGSLR